MTDIAKLSRRAVEMILYHKRGEELTQRLTQRLTQSSTLTLN